MHAAPRESALSRAVVTEAVRLIEQAGPLDDGAAMRSALVTGSDPARRVALRAQALGERIGLQLELARARHWAPWVGLGLVLLIVTAGLGLAGGVTGDSARRINVVAALASLLGLHLLTLALWLVGLALPLASFGASLGGLWLMLTARVAGGRHGQAPVLLRAATQLLARARLLPWAFGFVSHAIWSLSFAVVLAALLFALAFRSYTLSWETTILDPDFFVRFVRALGRVPAWLGFPVPDAQTVLAPVPVVGSPGATTAPGAAGQRTWALWLTGCIVVYGLLPRLFFTGLSALVWQRRKAALQPDRTDPYYDHLLRRFEALEPATIVEADPGASRPGTPEGLRAAEVADVCVVAGYELPPEWPWPPPGLPAAARVLRIDGSARARRELLDTVARLRPRLLLLACRAEASPDRGTGRLLRELLSHCGECRLWLLGAGESGQATVAGPDDASHKGPSDRHDDNDEARQRWCRWLADVGLECVAAHIEPASALQDCAG